MNTTSTNWLDRLRLIVRGLNAHDQAQQQRCGGIVAAYGGYYGYDASFALMRMEDFHTREIDADWRVLTKKEIARAWAIYARSPLWGEEYMTRAGFDAALQSLLWDSNGIKQARPA